MSSAANIKTIGDSKREERNENPIKWEKSMEDEIQRCVRSAMSSFSGNNAFDALMERFQSFYDRPCTNMVQLSKRTKQQSGLLWEHFCLMYLREKGYGEAWLIGDTPDGTLNELNLSRRDMGIDIVVRHENGYMAVQCKWRSNRHKKPKISLTWNQLSTFYALCARSGPWLKYIVMTNCDYVRRIGKKCSRDQTIAKAAFRSQPREVWQKIGGLGQGHCLTEKKHEKPTGLTLTSDEIRIKRLEALSKPASIKDSSINKHKENSNDTEKTISNTKIPRKFTLKK